MVPPLVRSAFTGQSLTASNNAFCCFGQMPSSPTAFQAGHSGRYLGRFPHCLAPSGSSLGGKGLLTSSHHCVAGILAKDAKFVKPFQLPVSISSALFNVVSVMVAPPMIRASSRFLPSRSKGVTVV